MSILAKDANGVNQTIQTTDDLTALVGTLAQAAVTNPDIATATMLGLLRGILRNTGNGVTLDTDMQSAISAALTTTVAGVVITAPGAGIGRRVLDIIISNAHATAFTEVEILSGTTVLAVLPAPPLGGAVHSFSIPLKGAAANAINARCRTAANVTVTATYYDQA